MSRVLCLWSGPRNISTAMMRSFGARADTLCWDEPFFAAYLHQTGLEHPGRKETLAVCETDAETIAAQITAPVDTPYHFQKHMAHHMIAGMPTAWMAEARHVLLLRHPARVIASYAKGRPNFVAEDLGFSRLLSLHGELKAASGIAPMIVDSDDILSHPEGSLRAICETGFAIPFDPAMLSWKAGARPEDGPWATYWYDSVIKSTGFGPVPGALPDIAPEHADIFAACQRDYDALRADAATTT